MLCSLSTKGTDMNEIALKIAVKIIKNAEGCNLIAYPDPASPLYKALSNNNMLQKYMGGAVKWNDLPVHFKALSGTPWTCGYGETEGVTKDTVWTQAEAESKLTESILARSAALFKAVPAVAKLSNEKQAACVSLAYNIGTAAFKTSTVVKKIVAGDMKAAADAFLMWNRAGGKIMDGLSKRREIERSLFLSVNG